MKEASERASSDRVQGTATKGKRDNRGGKAYEIQVTEGCLRIWRKNLMHVRIIDLLEGTHAGRIGYESVRNCSSEQGVKWRES